MTASKSTTQKISTDTFSSEEAITNELVEDAAETNHIEVIETVISSLEEDDSAMVSKTDTGHLWKFCYGSVEVFVQLTGDKEDDILTVWSCVLTLPTKNDSGLMQKLLEMNWSGTFETCFGINDKQVVVLTQRTLAGLTPTEISRAITLVATIADENNQSLVEEFGAA